MKRGFTLIELLVVISIIALLASIVLASLNTARDRGKIGAARHFATQVDHVAGEQAVGLWDFDECSNTSAKDRSGFGNTATLFNTPTTPSATYSGKGCAIGFDGSTQYGQVTNSTSLQPLTGNWTVGFWIYRTGTGASDYPQIIGARPWSTVTDNGWSVSYSTATGKMSTHFADGTVGWDVASPQSISTVPLNIWQYWTVVFDRTNGKLLYYLNGQLDAQYTPTFPTGSVNQSNTIYIGREIEAGNARRLNAYLDDIHVFAKNLTASEIGKLYADASALHPDFAQK